MGTVDNDKVFVGSLPSQSLYEYCFDADQQCWKVYGIRYCLSLPATVKFLHGVLLGDPVRPFDNLTSLLRMKVQATLLMASSRESSVNCICVSCTNTRHVAKDLPVNIGQPYLHRLLC